MGWWAWSTWYYCRQDMGSRVFSSLQASANPWGVSFCTTKQKLSQNTHPACKNWHLFPSVKAACDFSRVAPVPSLDVFFFLMKMRWQQQTFPWKSRGTCFQNTGTTAHLNTCNCFSVEMSGEVESCSNKAAVWFASGTVWLWGLWAVGEKVFCGRDWVD